MENQINRDLPLSAYERWMVRSNLTWAKTHGINSVVAELRHNGFSKVAAAVLEEHCKMSQPGTHNDDP